MPEERLSRSAGIHEAPYLTQMYDDNILGNPAVEKTKLVGKFHIALSEANLGGVVQAKGSSGKSVTFICQSVSPHRKKDDGPMQAGFVEKYSDQIISVARLNREEAGELSFKNETISATALDNSILSMTVDSLKSELHDNSQFKTGNHLELAVRVSFGRAFGRLPKCDLCGGYLDWSSQSVGFFCRGNMRMACSIMKFTFKKEALQPWTSQLQGPLCTKVKCRFHIKFVLSRVNGWGILKEEFHPKHSQDCTANPRYNKHVLDAALKDAVQFDPSGKPSCPPAMIARQLNLTSVSSSSLSRCIQRKRAILFDLPREKCNRVLCAILKRFSAANPSSLIVVRVTKNGEPNEFEIQNGIVVKKDASVSKVVVPNPNSSARRPIEQIKAKYDRLAATANAKRKLLLNLMDKTPVSSEVDGPNRYKERFEANEKDLAELPQNFIDEVIEASLLDDVDKMLDSDEFHSFDWDEGNFQDEDFEGGGTLVSITVVFGCVVQISKLAGKNVFFIDGAHMKDGRKGDGKGQLLMLVTEDALAKIYPVGFCYCYSEDTVNIYTLLNTLKKAGLDLNDRGKIIMCDRSRAATAALRVSLPNANVRYCLEHIIRNAQFHKKKKMSDATANVVRGMAKESDINAFSLAKSKLDSIAAENKDTELVDYIFDIDKLFWTYHALVETGVRTHARKDNNLAETENARQHWTRRQRSPAETLYSCASIVAKIIGRQQTVAVEYARGHEFILPSILKNVEELKEQICKFRVVSHGSGSFFVGENQSFSSQHGNRWMVDTKQIKCTCGAWQDKGIPCAHAFAVKAFVKEKVTDQAFYEIWFDPIYRTQNYVQALSETLKLPSLTFDVEDMDTEALFSEPGELPKPKRGRNAEEKRMKSNGEI